MQNELPIRWVLRETQSEKGLSPRKRLVLQMKVMVVDVGRPQLVNPDGSTPERSVTPQWVDVPTAEEAEESEDL